MDGVRERVATAIEEGEVVVFLKHHPRDRFSRETLELVRRYRPDANAVAADGDLAAFRAALREFSDWETLPQVYVDGEFVGDGDVLAAHARRGDLRARLNVE